MGKSKAIIFLALVVFGFSCSKQKQSVQLINTLGIYRTDAPVTLLASNLNGIKMPLITDAQGNELAYQLDDFDNDGIWDELFLLVDIAADDTITLKITPSEVANIASPRVHIQFAAKDGIAFDADTIKRLHSADTKITSQHFQMEGPAWENENVGFRNYYDGRNGMDIFGKQTSKMVLAKAGINGQNYHALDDWGMDILKVGNSLGAGAIALQQGDSIYRWSGKGEAGFHMLNNGPLKASFQLSFNDWQLKNELVKVTHTISIIGGTQYYQSSVVIEGTNDEVQLVTGIVNLHIDSLVATETGQFAMMLTHDKQAENQAYLGMGLLLPKSKFLEAKEAPQTGSSVVDTYMGILNLESTKSTNFYFVTGWQNQDQRFENKSFFDGLMKKSALEITNPIIVNY